MPGFREQRGEEAVKLLEEYLTCEDEWRGYELLEKYEEALRDFYEGELDWKICFRCGIQLVSDDGKRHLNRGQTFTSWGRYSLAQLCSKCGNDIRPIKGPLPSLEETMHWKC